jgi:hypothetical protein
MYREFPSDVEVPISLQAALPRELTSLPQTLAGFIGKTRLRLSA